MIKLKQKANHKQIVLAGLLSLTLVFGFSGMPNVVGQTTDELKQMQQEKQKKLDEINQKIKALQSQIKDRQNAAKTLNNQITVINLEIQETETQLEATSNQIDVTNLDIAETTDQIVKAMADIAKEKQVLRELIVSINDLDQMSPLEVALENDNFTEFLDKLQYASSIQERSQDALNQIKLLKSMLEEKNVQLKQQKDELDQLKQQQEITQDSLTSQKNGKQQLLTQTKGQEKAYQKLLAENQALEDQVQREVSELELELRKRMGDRTLPPMRGLIAYPMKGTLTQGYGNTGFTKLGYTFHNGIDIAAAAGTPIYAAADGVVADTGTGKGAYGNWVTMKHTITTKSGISRGIITLYGHMSSFKVRKGQTLKRGDLIGYEGNTGITTALLYGPGRGYHIHFSVFDAEGYGVSPGTVTKYGNYMVPYGYSYNPFDYLE
ncbi:MAG: murein hydrolase activator EnvC family protein [Acidobacteriaceae bacterium]